MTVLIAFVDGIEAAAGAARAGAPVVEIADPGSVAASCDALAGRARLSVLSSAEAFDPATLSGADRVAIRLSALPAPAVRDLGKRLDGGPWAPTDRIAVLPPDAVLAGMLEALREAGFGAVRLEPGTQDESLTRGFAIPELGRVAGEAREKGFDVEFSGRLEAPDVPRLLPLAPSALRFDRSLEPNGAFDPAALRELLQLLSPEREMAGTGTDRILVRDLVVEMAIGAYAHERGRRQRVRFNVEAEIRRGAATARSMGDVYSYDLVTDSVAVLTGNAHVDFVETLAEDLAARLLGDSRVVSVMVRVEKLDLGPGAVGIEIRRP